MFPPKVDVLDEPSKEVWLVQLNEADVLRILAETLAAHIEAVFPDQTVFMAFFFRPSMAINTACLFTFLKYSVLSFQHFLPPDKQI